jgi:hypothetical protein
VTATAGRLANQIRCMLFSDAQNLLEVVNQVWQQMVSVFEKLL